MQLITIKKNNRLTALVYIYVYTYVCVCMCNSV